jgi:putative restriction endonuclease
MNDRSSKYGQAWTREELILAFDLYCRIPFKQTKASNRSVQELAQLLLRTPAAVARKLGNFGAFDPELRKRGISGLVHASKLDKEIWNEFNTDWNGLVLEAHRLRSKRTRNIPVEQHLTWPEGPSERTGEVKIRIHQAFFREAVLSSYDVTCCITGLGILECLVASHIVPWSCDERKRADPTNGLCLSATFDRLFDRGLLSITDDMTVRISKRLLDSIDGAVQRLIIPFHGREIILPNRFFPSQENLRWHLENVFQA